MENTTDLDTKYQKLATEYSKVRAQATVLKKAVLDEQAKNIELKELVKKHEQQIRKHNQEMESLTFRNEQLTKRISVLQQELQITTNHTTTTKKGGKSGKNISENHGQTDFTVLDEELQKKIMENAQLVSSMADKEFELSNCKEKMEWLEKKLNSCEQEWQQKEVKFVEEIERLKEQKSKIQQKLNEIQTNSFEQNKFNQKESNDQIKYCEEQVERWKSECELLRSKPTSNEQLTEYYESQIREIFESKQISQSESKSLLGENQALYTRIENLILEKKELETNLDKCNEELLTTNENYKSQLDAMTEHLAAQNEKITKQCDEIQAFKHKFSTKK